MEELKFAPGERDAFQRVWSWSFRRMVEGIALGQEYDPGADDYDPKPDVERLSDQVLEFVVSQGSGCPMGYLAAVEKSKRDGQIIDWKFDGFRSDGCIHTSLVLKEPLKYIRMDLSVGSLETQ